MAAPVAISSMMVGDVRLTHLPDGYHRCDPTGSIVGSTDADWLEHPQLLDDHGRLVMTMGSILVELSDGCRALIDLGFGPRSLILADLAMEFWGGRLMASLAQIDLVPGDIDVVLFSHLHLDHVGWTTGERECLTFPNARHLMSSAEWLHWTSEERVGGPSATDLAALPERLELVDGERTVAPGLRVLPTPGHTPGHVSFLVESAGERAIVLGDAVHCPLQITHAEWNYAGDIVPDVAARTRAALVRELEQPATVAVGAHFPDAVFARVVADSVPRRVSFDVAAPAPTQAIAAEAPDGALFLAPLD